MVISVASGKGGTGKTTIAVNLALALPDTQYLDCDVEEPNGHIFLKPDIKKRVSVTLPYPRVDEKTCDLCGECAEVCEYGAIAVVKNQVLIFDDLCHSCGSCVMLCPQKAIYEVRQEIGRIEIGEGKGVSFAHGILKLGSTRAHPLVEEVKKYSDASKTVIIDAPPGTSCPVVEAVKGTDYCLLVTEPTPFGLNDLRLAVEMTRAIGVPSGIVINRSDGNDRLIEDYAAKEGLPILLRVPMERQIAEAYSKGISLVEWDENYRDIFKTLFATIEEGGAA
ncbi:MAG: P-loop NTPase [Calditrichaeota bacterium]|nr:P-loop NTPase [Calditrichota bacterium]